MSQNVAMNYMPPNVPQDFPVKNSSLDLEIDSTIAQQKQAELNKKFSKFTKHAIKMANIKSLKHVSFVARGKEELVIRVKAGERSFLSNETSPYDDSNELSPASPFSREIEERTPDTIVFLLGMYSKYGRPVVWVRTNHELFLKNTRFVHKYSNDNISKDYPLRLRTTDAFENDEIMPWQIVAELVLSQVGSHSSHDIEFNPFEIDYEHLDTISGSSALTSIASLIKFLRYLYVELANTENQLASKILDDIEKLSKKYFSCCMRLSSV